MSGAGCVLALIGFAAALFFDQFTKYLAVSRLKDKDPFVLIEGVFEFRYLENRGAAFGMMQDMQYLLAAGALLICGVIIFLYLRMPRWRRYVPLRICAVLLCAGAIGNMIDRIRLHYVIDFLYFRLIDFPIFNVADCYVVVSCIVFALLILFYYREEDDFSFLAGKRKVKTMEEPNLTATQSGERIDRFLSIYLEDLSRSYIQKLLKEGAVMVNGNAVKSSYKINAGDEILVHIPDPEPMDILPEDIPLDILYEDGDILVINKPKGMVVHPSPGHYSHTLVNAVLYHCGGRLSGINGVLRPGIVHRIDMDTTGSLLICKNDRAHQILADELKAHNITRRYHAVVHGNLKEDTGTVNAPIGRHPVDRKKMSTKAPNGRAAVTHYRVLERFGNYTYIECELETGRTHQIRVHMASIGHPILGDAVYGPAKCPFKLEGQTLHAKILGIVHPTTRKYMEFDASLPEYFETLLKRLRSMSA